MGQSQIEKWNERYRDGHDDLPIPLPFFVDFASTLRPPGRALDIACGTGRHAIWLAERGWKVEAVDGSAVAIEQLRDRGLPILATVADIEAPDYRIEGEFDLIVDTFFLHRPLFPMIQGALRPGGAAVLAFHAAGRFGIEMPELDRLFPDYERIHQVVHSEPFTVELIVRRPSIA